MLAEIGRLEGQRVRTWAEFSTLDLNALVNDMIGWRHLQEYKFYTSGAIFTTIHFLCTY
jgi:hypothetical protein